MPSSLLTRAADLEWAAPKVSAAHVQGLENNERHFKDVLGGNGGDIFALILFSIQWIREHLQETIDFPMTYGVFL